MKNIILVIVLFLFQSKIFAQENRAPDWYLPFSEKALNNETDIKNEIEKVITAFDKRNEALELNLKMIEDVKADEEDERGGLGRVYTYNNRVIATEWSHPWGANGSQTCYLDRNQNIRLVVMSANGSTWYREWYIYLNQDKKGWVYSIDRTVSYKDGGGTGQTIDGHLPLSKRLGKLIYQLNDYRKPTDDVEFDYERSKELITEVVQKAKQKEQDRTGTHYFAGEMSWKYPFIMELNIPADGKILGKYKYKKSAGDLTLEGQLTEERFVLTEKDKTGKVTGTFKGRFIGDTMERKVEGKWYKPNSNKFEYFDLKTISSYSFNKYIN